MLALGSAVVTEVQAACVPGPHAPVHCYTAGFGGSLRATRLPDALHDPARPTDILPGDGEWRGWW
jgi:hypothetical protein